MVDQSPWRPGGEGQKFGGIVSHGTGALKTGVRSWLNSSAYVQEWGPATHEQGGDAFTVVLLRG